MELPNEIEWNIIKFMRHPVAEAFEEVRWEYPYDDTFVQSWFRRIFMLKVLVLARSDPTCSDKDLKLGYNAYYKLYSY